MVDLGKSGKVIKISGKGENKTLYYEFRSHISFFIQESEEDLPWIKNEILLVNPL